MCKDFNHVLDQYDKLGYAGTLNLEGDTLLAQSKSMSLSPSDFAYLYLFAGNKERALDWTALMFATMRGDVESVKNLIDAKADVNSRTTDGETPLRRATELEYKEIIIILKKAGAK
jgi:hypothetical protein